MAGGAADLAAHGVQLGAEPAHALERDQVLGGARPVELTVGQPADQRPAGELTDGRVDLGHAHVVPACEGAAAWQLPAWLPVHECRRHPVSEYTAGRALSGYDSAAFRWHLTAAPYQARPRPCPTSNRKAKARSAPLIFTQG